MKKISFILFTQLFLFSSATYADSEDFSTQMLMNNCYTCHTDTAHSKSLNFVPLDNKSSSELVIALLAYKNDKNKGTIMNRIAKGYTEEQIDRIANYISSQK